MVPLRYFCLALLVAFVVGDCGVHPYAASPTSFYKAGTCNNVLDGESCDLTCKSGEVLVLDSICENSTYTDPADECSNHCLACTPLTSSAKFRNGLFYFPDCQVCLSNSSSPTCASCCGRLYSLEQNDYCAIQWWGSIPMTDFWFNVTRGLAFACNQAMPSMSFSPLSDCALTCNTQCNGVANSKCVSRPLETIPYECVCKPGFESTGSDGTGDTGCADVNECTVGTPCHADANCDNTPGGYNCTCKTGFTGNGTICVPVAPLTCDNAKGLVLSNGTCVCSSIGWVPNPAPTLAKPCNAACDACDDFVVNQAAGAICFQCTAADPSSAACDSCCDFLGALTVNPCAYGWYMTNYDLASALLEETLPICGAAFNIACVPPCENGIRDNDEGDVDCGGSCPVQCAAGAMCAVPADCETGVCSSGGLCVKAKSSGPDTEKTGKILIGVACAIFALVGIPSQFLWWGKVIRKQDMSGTARAETPTNKTPREQAGGVELHTMTNDVSNIPPQVDLQKPRHSGDDEVYVS